MELNVGVEFGRGESKQGSWVWAARCCHWGMWEGDRKSGTQRRQLTGMLAPFYEEEMVEGTRIISPKESKLGVGGNAGCSEIQLLNRPASCDPMGQPLMADGR